MKFTLEIELSNEDGKLRNVDIETALQFVARQFHVPGDPCPAHGKVKIDAGPQNGAVVGFWDIGSKLGVIQTRWGAGVF